MTTMKKLFRYTIIVPLIIFGVFWSLSSCSKSDTENEDKGGNLVGTWYFISGEWNYNNHFDGSCLIIQFNKDGSCYAVGDWEIFWTGSGYFDGYDIAGYPLESPYYKTKYKKSGNILTIDCAKETDDTGPDGYGDGLSESTTPITLSYTVSGQHLILNGGGDPNMFPANFGLFSRTFEKSQESINDYVKDKVSYWKKYCK